MSLEIKIKEILTKSIIYIASRKSLNVQKKYDPKATLTKEEKHEIKMLWGRLPVSTNYVYHQLAKAVDRFDARYLPEDVYNPLVKGSLNPMAQSLVFENKGLYDILFPTIPQPRIFLKNVAGQFFKDKEPIFLNDAIDAMMKVEEAIVKPSMYSDSGNNVIKFVLKSTLSEVEKREQIVELFKKYKSDFVVQSLIQQHPETAIFNPQSVNTIRVSSLFINGKVSLHSPIFRCGQNGSIVDNTGAGGIVVGVKDNGELCDFGYDLQLNKIFKTSNDIEFKNKRIANYSKLEKIIVDNHKLLPTVHFIGWDFAFDESGNPIMLELNIGFPGIIFEQFCSGPIFGDRTEEVIEYVRSNPPKLKIGL